jgi:hypothetical protein
MRFATILVAILFMLTGCATTEFTSVWKDESFKGHPRKLMVIGMAKKPVLRRVFEDEFVRQLKNAGTDAVASYKVISTEKLPDEQVIAAKMREVQADAVLITRLVDKKVVRTYVPGRMDYPMGFWYDRYPAYYGTWPSYYSYGSSFMYSPGYVAEDQYALMETCLYAADGGNLIWSATSETMINRSDQKMIKSFIEAMVDKLQEQGLLKK